MYRVVIIKLPLFTSCNSAKDSSKCEQNAAQFGIWTMHDMRYGILRKKVQNVHQRAPFIENIKFNTVNGQKESRNNINFY